MPARMRLWLWTGLAAPACVLALAACGGSSKPKRALSHAGVFMAFSRCMRSNGVTNFPDPSSGGGIQLSASVNTESPAFKAAQNNCFKLLPHGGPFGHKPSARQIRDVTNSAACMREHGVTGFPDPIVSSEPPNDVLNPVNYGSITDAGGLIIAIPKSIDEQSPAFEKAAKTCGFNG